METEMQRYYESGKETTKKKKNRGRDWSYAAISPGMHRFPINTGSEK